MNDSMSEARLMHEMVTMLSSVIPEEDLIQMLEDAIEKYKREKDLKGVGMICSMILSKCSIDMADGGLEQVRKDLRKLDAGINLLNIDGKEQ